MQGNGKEDEQLPFSTPHHIKSSSSEKRKGLGMGKHPLPTQTGAMPGAEQKPMTGLKTRHSRLSQNCVWSSHSTSTQQCQQPRWPPALP